MKLKWIALVLACALLLCGCRQVESANSNGASADASVGEMSHRYRWTGFDGEGGEKRYRDAISAIHTLEDIKVLFDDNAGYPKEISGDDFKMILQDRFFLIPVLEDSTLSSMTLYASGSTRFTVRLPDRCKLFITVYHDDTEYSDVSGAEFTTVDHNTFIHEHNTNKADVFYMRAGNYWVVIGGFDVCECKQSYVENLTFENVEIK